MIRILGIQAVRFLELLGKRSKCPVVGHMGHWY